MVMTVFKGMLAFLLLLRDEQGELNLHDDTFYVNLSLFVLIMY